MKKPEFLIVLLLLSVLVLVFLNKSPDLRRFYGPSIIGSGSVLVKNSVDVIIIKPDCEDCYDAENLVDGLVSAGLNVSSVSVLSASEGYGFVFNYSIEKLPAVIFSSEIVNYSFYSGLSFYGSLESDVFVFRSPNPPFYDVVSGEIEMGDVSVVYVNHSGCGKCYDVLVHGDILESTYGLNIVSESFADESSELISEFNITKLPTVIISSEAQLYPALMRVWHSTGVIVNNSLVFTNMDALGKVWYYDLDSDEIK